MAIQDDLKNMLAQGAIEAATAARNGVNLVTSTVSDGRMDEASNIAAIVRQVGELAYDLSRALAEVEAKYPTAP